MSLKGSTIRLAGKWLSPREEMACSRRPRSSLSFAKLMLGLSSSPAPAGSMIIQVLGLIISLNYLSLIENIFSIGLYVLFSIAFGWISVLGEFFIYVYIYIYIYIYIWIRTSITICIALYWHKILLPNSSHFVKRLHVSMLTFSGK